MFVHATSELGKRDANEDKHVVFLNLDDDDKKHAPINLFCIFDGHGGSKVSAYLEKNLKLELIKRETKFPLSRQYIHNMYTNLQKNIKKSLGKYADDMGSTALVIIHYNNRAKHNKNSNELSKEYLQIINLGDSRAIINNNGRGEPLTIDHKPNWPDEKKRITDLKGELTFDGVDWRIKGISVSRAFGDVSANPYITYIPDIFKRTLKKKDKFIVLACDGLWDVMDPQEVTNFILNQMKIDSKTGNLICKDKRKNIAKLLAEYAIKVKKSGDNVSIIIVFL